MQILSNEFSSRYERFMQSKLVEVFALGVHDPQKVVGAGDGYSLKGYEGDRKD